MCLDIFTSSQGKSPLLFVFCPLYANCMRSSSVYILHSAGCTRHSLTFAVLGLLCILCHHWAQCAGCASSHPNFNRHRERCGFAPSRVHTQLDCIFCWTRLMLGHTAVYVLGVRWGSCRCLIIKLPPRHRCTHTSHPRWCGGVLGPSVHFIFMKMGHRDGLYRSIMAS